METEEENDNIISEEEENAELNFSEIIRKGKELIQNFGWEEFKAIRRAYTEGRRTLKEIRIWRDKIKDDKQP